VAEGYKADVLISNYDSEPEDFSSFTMRPYESVVFHLKK
jgi:trehalose-6-phosphate hydrolase